MNKRFKKQIGLYIFTLLYGVLRVRILNLCNHKTPPHLQGYFEVYYSLFLACATIECFDDNSSR
jgi:hypothetical protein